MTKSCVTCRFWGYPAAYRDEAGGMTPVCRRRAPIAVPVLSSYQGMMHSGVFPSTMGSEWCGEWEALPADTPSDAKESS